MEELDRAAFEAAAADYDATVLETEGVDAFCSSSHWILPAHDAFHAELEPLFLWCPHGYAVFGRGMAPEVGRYLAPLEAVWGLASPVACRRPDRLARALMNELSLRRREWDLLWLGGLAPDAQTFLQFARRLGTRYRVGLGPRTARHVASLAGGFDGFLARRSAGFRAKLRRAMRRAEEHGVTFERIGHLPDAAAVDTLVARVMAVEVRSWKGHTGEGIDQGPMRAFYDAMIPRLADQGLLRAVFGRLGTEDVSYVFGGALGDTYRGLQMSFDESCRPLALGNVTQAAMIAALAEEGVTSYDLGSDIDYKTRWARGGLVTAALVTMR